MMRLTDLPQDPLDPVALPAASARTARPSREFLDAVLSEQRGRRVRRVRSALLCLLLAVCAGIGSRIPGFSAPRRIASGESCVPSCPSGQTCYKGSCVKAAAQVASCLRTLEEYILETRGGR